MERAYAQARHWPADRSWRRAYVQMSAGQVAPGVGMYLCLLDHYARRDGIRELFETCDWLLARMETLKPAERLSMCRIVCHMVRSLKEDEFDVREARLKLILRIPLAVILDAVAEQRLSCALTGLLEFSRVFEESVTIKQCSEFEGDFMGVALAIDRAIRAGKVRDEMKDAETKTCEEHERERLDAATLAQLIKKTEIDKSTTSKWTPGSPAKPLSLGDVMAQSAESESEQSLVQGSEESQISDEPKTALDLLEKTKESVVCAIKAFSLRSEQVAHKLADLIVVKSEQFPDMVLNADLQHLSEIVADDEVDMSPYVLRKILSTVGTVDEKKGLLTVLSAIEKSVLSKRERQIGVDISLGITLWRLISLWRLNDSLAEGSAYCELLLQRLTDSRGVDDPVVKQLSSAIWFIAALKAGSFKWRENYLGAQSRKIDEAAEFAAMLSTIALDSACNGSVQNAELVMNELLCFYADTVGDTGRQVGEMLWLVQETQLNQLRNTVISLISQSNKNTRDAYLDARFKAHIRRLVVLTEDPERRTEIVSSMLLAQYGSNAYDKTLEEIKEIVALCTFKQCYENEAKAERKRIMTGESLKSKSSSVLIQLELDCMEKNWEEFQQKFEKNGPSINAEESFYSLVQLAICLLKNQQIEHSAAVLNKLFSHTTPSCAEAFNHLVEEIKRQLVVQGKLEQAIGLLELALSGQFQSTELKNRLRLQLAELKVMTGNLFEATALIYQAFSDIPDASYDSTGPLHLEGK